MTLEARIQFVTRRGGHPLALLDLDLTLVDNGPRTRAILASWLDAFEHRLREARAASELTASLEGARTLVRDMPLRFSIRENLLATVPAALHAAPDHLNAYLTGGLRHWLHAFFHPDWLVHDEPLDGAVAAVRALVEADVTIVYVTARQVDLAAATVASLHRMGFPVAGPRSVLVTKTDPHLTDHASKVEALDFAARLGEVVLCAENEPAHANEMHERFPDALTVLVATRHSEPAPALHPGIVRLPRLADVLPSAP
jgi:phosphoglycolate phosphatase-like HAD superfamily hydrolase